MSVLSPHQASLLHHIVMVYGLVLYNFWNKQFFPETDNKTTVKEPSYMQTNGGESVRNQQLLKWLKLEHTLQCIITDLYPEPDETNLYPDILDRLSLSSHPCCILISSLFFSVSLSKILCVLSPLLCRLYVPSTSYPPWVHHPNNKYWRVNIMILCIMQHFPASC